MNRTVPALGGAIGERCAASKTSRSARGGERVARHLAGRQLAGLHGVPGGRRMVDHGVHASLGALSPFVSPLRALTPGKAGWRLKH